MKTFVPGLRRDVKDSRDRMRFRGVSAPLPSLPQSFRVAGGGAIHEQGEFGSCAGHAGSWFYEQILRSRGSQAGPISPRHLWYRARELEGVQGRDDGVTLRSVVKALNKHGAMPSSLAEGMEDVVISAANLADAPSAWDNICSAALKLAAYARCETLDSIKRSIATEQQSVLIGLPVYEGWMREGARRTGLVNFDPMDNLLGHHAMVAVGYDDRAGRLTVVNSWGLAYGDEGCNHVSYEYLASEFWDAWTADFEALPDARTSGVQS